MTLAVVLGGGGSAALGWEFGVLAGLAEAGVELSAPMTLVGTSAGALVAVRLSRYRSLAGWPSEYERFLSAPVARAPEVDFAALNRSWSQAVIGADSPQEARRRIGELALAARTMPVEQRRDELAALLPATEWPEADLRITAVSARTGSLRVFTAADGVPLIDAVGASCAVPGVWPVVMIEGEPFMDGAVRSPVNVSIAREHDQVLVLAPMPGPGGLERELAALNPTSRRYLISADATALTEFGLNPLDPLVGAASARTGHRQGRLAAAELRRQLGPDSGSADIEP